jgi:hypothetical protein
LLAAADGVGADIVYSEDLADSRAYGSVTSSDA